MLCAADNVRDPTFDHSNGFIVPSLVAGYLASRNSLWLRRPVLILRLRMSPSQDSSAPKASTVDQVFSRKLQVEQS